MSLILNVVHQSLRGGLWNSKHSPAKENIFVQCHHFLLFIYHLCLFVKWKPGPIIEFWFVKGFLKHYVIELQNSELNRNSVFLGFVCCVYVCNIKRKTNTCSDRFYILDQLTVKTTISMKSIHIICIMKNCLLSQKGI